MKKLFLAFMSLVFVMIFVALKPLKIDAATTNDLEDLWGEKTKTYLSNDYSTYCNENLYGKYYKVGVMGHRMMVNISSINLSAYIVEEFIPSKSVGLASSTTVTSTKTYTIVDQIISREEVKVGICDEISSIVKLEDYGSVGTNTSTTTEYTFAIEKTYSESLYKSLEVTDVLDYTTIPDDKKTFSVSRVACYLEFNISKSCTQEQKLWGWRDLSDTVKTNYHIRYYLADVICYCYNDNTFGDTKMGVYPLTTIKNY